MRARWRLFSLSLLPIAALACFGSGSSPPGDAGPSPDVGFAEGDGGDAESSDAAGRDASLPDAKPQDASPPDANAQDATGADAPNPDADAAPLPIALQTRNASGPEANVAIVFSDPAGAFVAQATTGATGQLVEPLPAGATQVTALFGEAGAAQRALVTYVDIAPGDSLTLVDPTLAPTPTVTVAALPAGQPPTAIAYQAIVGNCDGMSFDAPPGTVTLSAGCSASGTFPLLVLASGAAGYVGYAFQNGNPLAADAGAASVNVGGTWQTTFGTQSIQLTGTWPPAVLGVSEIAGGVPFVQSRSLASPGNGFTYDTHPGYADFIQSEIDVPSAAGGTQSIATRGAPPTDAELDGGVTFDPSQLMPSITAAAVADTPSVARPTVSWTSSAPLSGAAGAFAHFDWLETTDSGLAIDIAWTLVVPPGTSSVEAPALPPALDAWAPAQAGGASFSAGSPAVIVVQGDGLSGYGALRAAAGAFLVAPPINQGVLLPPLPADGTLLATAFAPPLQTVAAHASRPGSVRFDDGAQRARPR